MPAGVCAMTIYVAELWVSTILGVILGAIIGGMFGRFRYVFDGEGATLFEVSMLCSITLMVGYLIGVAQYGGIANG